MKFSEKLYLITILKVTKNQGLTLSLGKSVLEKPQRGSQTESPTLPTPKLLRINLFLIV